MNHLNPLIKKIDSYFFKMASTQLLRIFNICTEDDYIFISYICHADKGHIFPFEALLGRLKLTKNIYNICLKKALSKKYDNLIVFLIENMEQLTCGQFKITHVTSSTDFSKYNTRYGDKAIIVSCLRAGYGRYIIPKIEIFTGIKDCTHAENYYKAQLHHVIKTLKESDYELIDELSRKRKRNNN